MYKKLATIKIGLFTGIVEVWKDVEGYEGVYQISSFGNLKSLPRVRYGKNRSIVPVSGRVMKQKTSRCGYKVVHLRRDEKSDHPSIHRLVAIAFISNPYNKETVNHIDGNKANNNVKNLEWATHSEQMNHAVKMDLLEVRGSPKFTKEFKQEIYNYYHSHDVSLVGLCEMFGVSERTAGRIVKGVVPRTTTRIRKNGSRTIENILTKEQVEEIKKLRNEGWTFIRLAEKFNRGLSQMHRVVNNMSRNTHIE